MHSMFAANPWNLRYAAGIVALHVLLVYTLVWTRPLPGELAVGVAMWVWFGLAQSLFYHRHLAHRSCDLAAPVRWVLLLGALASQLGGPLRYACIHRQHHGHADTALDPHGPCSGLWYAYFGWIAKLDPRGLMALRYLVPDLEKEALLRLADRAPVQNAATLLVAGSLWAWHGAHAFLWCWVVPAAANFIFNGMLVGTVCHLPHFGRRPCDTRDDSRNVAWLGLLTFGEAFHNHHHAQPRRARMGLAWYEPDPVAYVLWGLERVRLARNVVWGSR